MKIYNKFVESKKEPSNKNDIWFDGSSWKMYKEGVWRSFTLPIELAKDIEDAVKDLDLGNYLKKTDVDSALSETSTNPVENKVITERLNNIKTATPDWSASKRESGFIKSRTHYVSGTRSIPFENWNKSIDENGDAIYSFFVGYNESYGCIIGDTNSYAAGEENYIFFETEWVSLSPAILADIRLNLDIESGDTLLEIKLYKDGDSEDYLKTFINNTLFATGNSDFTTRIAENFIPNTIARQESVDELREETTALWENLDHGTFPDLTAGDLAGRGESVPASFGFRASGGKSIKDGRAYIKRIKGNSVVWNQLCKSFENADIVPYIEYTILANGGVSIPSWVAYEPFRFNVGLTKREGHKYLLTAEYNDTSSSVRLVIQIGSRYITRADYGGIIAEIGTIPQIESGTFADHISIFTSASHDGTTTIQGLRFIDLTQMFGAGNEPSTIEEFQSRVATLGIEDMYAYNEGQVIHCNTESIKSVGDNAWNGEELIQGRLSDTTGLPSASRADMMYSPSFIRVIPNTEYYAYVGKQNGQRVSIYIYYYDSQYNFLGKDHNVDNQTFVTPSNACYIRFFIYATSGAFTEQFNDITISLYHSGWKAQKDEQYQPYWQDILPLPIINKYFPNGMKKAGSAHDEIRYNKASGKWEYSKGKIKSVDLGAFDYAIGSTNLADSKRMRALTKISDAIIPSSDAQVANILCGSYIAVSSNDNWQNSEGICISADGYLYVYDKEKQDAASFKADMADVMLYYESNDWEWVELDAEDQNFRDYYNVADFGTEQSQSNVPSAAFSVDIIYQFNAVDMIREHEAEINELQDAIKAMQAQLTSLINN